MSNTIATTPAGRQARVVQFKTDTAFMTIDVPISDVIDIADLCAESCPLQTPF
jgi:hypothetical protein